MTAVAQIPIAAHRPVKTRSELVEEVGLEGKRPGEPVADRSPGSPRVVDLRAVSAAGIDAAPPPMAESNVEQADQEAQAEARPRPNAGGNRRARNRDEAADVEALRTERRTCGRVED